MPLANRTILPTWLGRRPLSEEEKTKDVVQVAVCHNAVLGAIVQLASLVRHADDIFCDLAEECQNVFEKTESIGNKIQNVERIIRQLDSTEVKIPVGTLKQFSTVTDHHVAKHGFECDHFTPENRPHCIKFNYAMCDVTPVHALRGADMYRKDGLCSSHLFKLWPIALRDPPLRTDDMNIPRRFSSLLSHKKRYKTLKLRERRRTIHSIDELSQESERCHDDEFLASKDDHLSKSQPSILVSVDTSGASFERQASFRQSLREDETGRGRDRKKRRRTVSGVPENIMHEIEQFERGRRITRDGPRQYSLDDLDEKELEARDEIMQQYLLEIDAAIEEREEIAYAEQREAKLLKFLPCRRSRSLPRCVKLISGAARKDDLTRTSMYQKKHQKVPGDEVRLRRPADGMHSKFSSSASLGSLGGTDKRSSMSSKRSSMIGEKLKSLVTGTIKPRPKSLDFDSIEVKDESRKRDSGSRSADRSSSLSRVSSPSMPEGIMSRATSNESQIGPGSYYYFDSNTLPRAQAKKYDFPWDSLPKDWTTSVKLREISKRRKEDRQSSSGNWSQSGYSSNRQSLDSDVKSSMPSSTSQCSLGKDSGRDSPRSAGERDVLDTGYMGDATSTESVSDTKSVSNTDSDDWIRSLAERAAGRGDVTSTSAEALANLSRLTKQNIRNLDILVPGRMTIRKKRNELEDDGESSVYSLDQEGFYTSFHNDSGLRKSSTTLLDEEDDDLIMPRVRESKSLQSVASYSTVESVIFRPSEKDRDDCPSSQSSISSPNLASLAVNDPFLMAFGDSDIQDIDASEDQEGEVEYGDTGTLKAKKSKKGKKPPPPPPPRRSSTIRSQTNRLSSDGKNNPDDSPNSNETSSESSDHETVYARLKMKTSISAHAFPSWCPGNISDEDDFQERLNAESSEVEELCSAGKDNWLSGTLPRSSIVTESSDTHSWPRVKRSNIQQPGILKTPEKDKVRPVSGNPKILNFDPVVNLFDAQSPHGVQLPLSRLSSSDESGSPPSTTTTFDSHPLSHQMSTPIHNSLPGSFATESSKVAPSIDTPSKHQSVLYEMPGSKPTRPRSMVLNQKELQTASSTPIHSYHVTTPTSANGQYGHSNKDPSSRYLSSDLSAIHSVSNPSLASIDSFDAPPGATLSSFDKSKDTLGSNSTIALSDIDSSSFTHVSLTDSTPSGSTLSLNWDTDDTPNPTPMATPKHKRAPQNLPPSAKRTDNSTNERHSSSATDSMPNNAGNFSKTSVSNVPSASNPSELSVLPSTPFSSSSSSSSHQRNPVNGSQPQSSSSSSYHSGIHQPESGTVITAPNLSLGPSIMNKPSATPGHIISMQANDLSTNTGAPAANTNENISDSNNNKSKPSSFTILDSAMSKSSSWTGNQKMLDQNGSQSNTYPLHPPLNHSQSWSNAPLSTGYHQQPSHQQPPVGFASRSTQKERRRSSPVMNRATYYSSSSTHSGNEDSSGSGHASSGSDTVKRRRSGNDLSSPADSGFGSPSVFNQPSMTVQQFSYSPSATQNQNPFPVAQNQSKPSLSTPHIKKAMLPDPKTTFSDYVPKLGSGYGNSFQKSDFPVKALGSNSSHSSESLNSQLSSSSAQQLIPSKHKTDLSHPVLQRGNSSESVHSNSSAGRSDSYRVAMLADSDEVSLIPNKKININSNNGNISTHRRGSNPTEKGPSVPRTILTKSLSTPAPAACSDDGISRADSYRCAVRNTQSMVLGELMGRNSSYRLATNDEDVVITDNRMDACNLWTGSTGGTRDMRRMGITDIDQLKHYNNEPDTNGRGGNKRNSKQGDTLHAKKKLGIKGDTEGLINPVKTAAQDHKRFTKPNSKDKNKHKTQSSTYIRFDPIFESGEDLRASSESLRPPSIVSIRTLAKAESNETITSENAHLIGQKMGPTSPPRRRSASQGRRSTEDKSSRSILGSIKTSIKSIGGGKGE